MSPKHEPTNEDGDLLENILNNSTVHENFNVFISRLYGEETKKKRIKIIS